MRKDEGQRETGEREDRSQARARRDGAPGVRARPLRNHPAYSDRQSDQEKPSERRDDHPIREVFGRSRSRTRRQLLTIECHRYSLETEHRSARAFEHRKYLAEAQRRALPVVWKSLMSPSCKTGADPERDRQR